MEGAGVQTFYEWHGAQSTLQGDVRRHRFFASVCSLSGVLGTNAAVGSSLAANWGSVWVSAIATKPGHADSDVVRSARYRLRRIAALPVFSPDGGSHDAHLRSIAVTVTSGSELASIRYSIDGTTPTCGSTWGSCTGRLLNNCGGYCSKRIKLGPATTDAQQTFTLRAIAYRDGWSNSDVATSASFTVMQIVGRPYFTPNGGSFASSPQTVTISSSTSGATIQYTTAPNQEAAVYPSVVGTIYSSGISLSSTMGQMSQAVAGTSSVINVTAIATNAGWANSDVFANVFVVSEVSQWSSSNGVAVCPVALDFIRSGLNCNDVLSCRGTSSTDGTARVPILELATGECICK